MDIRLNAVAEESLRCALRTWLTLVNRYGYIGDYEVLQQVETKNRLTSEPAQRKMGTRSKQPRRNSATT